MGQGPGNRPLRPALVARDRLAKGSIPPGVRQSSGRRASEPSGRWRGRLADGGAGAGWRVCRCRGHRGPWPGRGQRQRRGCRAARVAWQREGRSRGPQAGAQGPRRPWCEPWLRGGCCQRRLAGRGVSPIQGHRRMGWPGARGLRQRRRDTQPRYPGSCGRRGDVGQSAVSSIRAIPRWCICRRPTAAGPWWRRAWCSRPRTVTSVPGPRWPSTIAAPARCWPCIGTGDGPALLLSGGVESIVGVTSRGDLACSRFGIKTRVDAYGDDFLVPAIAATQPGALGVGAACDEASFCASNLCITSEDSDRVRYCSAACQGDAGCPDPLRCRGGLCRYLPPSPGAPGARCEAPGDCAGELCVASSFGGERTCSPVAILLATHSDAQLRRHIIPPIISRVGPLRGTRRLSRRR